MLALNRAAQHFHTAVVRFPLDLIFSCFQMGYRLLLDSVFITGVLQCGAIFFIPINRCLLTQRRLPILVLDHHHAVILAASLQLLLRRQQ